MVSSTGGITIPTTFDIQQHWENLVEHGDNDTAVGSDDLEQDDESDFVYNNVDEGGENLGFNREDTFPLVPPTEGAASLNCIPWEQRRSLPPATAIATMGMYLEPSEHGRGFEWQRLPIVETPSGQLFQGGPDVEIPEDGHIIPVADDSEAYRFGEEGVINVGIPSFGFGLASVERGIPAAFPPPSVFVIDNLLARVETIPFEEEEKSLS